LTIQSVKQFFGQICINWTGPACLKNLRYFRRWHRSLFHGATPLSDEQPWITFDAIQYLEQNIKASHRVFEFGGGGSTLFFLKRCQEVVTVEHDADWFLRLEQRIENRQLKNWIGSLVEPEFGDLLESPNASNPDHYSSGSIGHVNFRKYASLIDYYPDEYFDVILVDGRSRPACIKHAVPKLKKGGFIVLDNADRTYYVGSEIEKILEKYSLVLSEKGPSPYVRFFTQTNIWGKIK
jgi:predicted O-methyltransferase YrrM